MPAGSHSGLGRDNATRHLPRNAPAGGNPASPHNPERAVRLSPQPERQPTHRAESADRAEVRQAAADSSAHPYPP